MFKRSLCVVAVCLLVSATGYVKVKQANVVGGVDTDIRRVPYQLGLRVQGGPFRCGAVLIGPMSALTAAHCIFGYSQLYQLSAGSNLHNNYFINVAKVVIHPEYIPTINGKNPFNDIAYLEFYRPVQFTATIQPAMLPSLPPVGGSFATVSGWGRISEEGPSPAILQSAQLQIVDLQKCKMDYQNTQFKITDTMVCAAVPGGGKGSCYGDSGGPLVVDGVLVGIVSWGFMCGSPIHPSVYVNVFRYLDWIRYFYRP